MSRLKVYKINFYDIYNTSGLDFADFNRFAFIVRWQAYNQSEMDMDNRQVQVRLHIIWPFKNIL